MEIINKAQLLKEINNIATFASMTDLIANVILNISGNDISNTINGSNINRSLVCGIAQSRILQQLDLKARA